MTGERSTALTRGPAAIAPPTEDLADLDAIAGRYLVTDDDIRTAAHVASYAMAQLSLIMDGIPIPRNSTETRS